MKAGISIVSIVASIALFTGCATQRQVASLEGNGDRRVYDAPFDVVWRSAVDAAQRSNLEVTTADRASGYIAARRTIQPHTFGENVGLWVRSLGPAQTEVEVVSRQAGPPVFWLKNWQNEIHRSVAANITREPSIGTAPAQTTIETGPADQRVYVPQPAAIAPTPQTTVIVPQTSTVVTQPVQPSSDYLDQQRRVQALREQLHAREYDLAKETDPARREAINRQIDRLRQDLGVEEQHLRDLDFRR